MAPEPKTPRAAGAGRPGVGAKLPDASGLAALVGLGGEAADAVSALLAEQGWQVVACDGVAAVLERLRTGACGLVLADAEVAGIAPWELAAQVKRLAPQTIVLVFSSDSSASVAVRAMRAGAYDFFAKPVSREEVRQRLGRALANRRLGLSLRRLALRLSFVNQLSSAFSSSLDLQQVLRSAVADLRAIADFDLALVVLREAPPTPLGAGPDGLAVVYPLTPGADELAPAERALPLQESALAWDFPPDNSPLVLSGLAGRSLTPDLAGLARGGFQEVVLLPLASKGRIIGVLALASRSGGAHAASDLDLLRHAGDHLSAAVVNAQLYAQLKSLSAQLEDVARERTREALEARRHLEDLMETAGDAIFTVDAGRRVASWNPGARQILGYTRDEALGRDAAFLASGDVARDQLARLIERALAGEVAANVEAPWQRKDGKEVTVSLTVSPIRSAAHEVTGVLLIARDVTERKRLQEELFHSEKLASIGQLAAGVAHQINNPLGAISGRAQMLLRQCTERAPDPAFLREQLAKVQADCARIADTVADLLGFARKTETVKQLTHVNLLLDETVEMVRHGRPAPGVRIERRYAPNLPPILGAPDLIRQLFANLMTNALDAMPDGGTLTLTTALRPAADEAPDSVVEVAFADTGVGIAPDDVPRIFEPFFTTKPPGQGTGLGLAVAQRIVSFHNGHIEVHTTLGVGTTFTVQLPIADRPTPPSSASP